MTHAVDEHSGVAEQFGVTANDVRFLGDFSAARRRVVNARRARRGGARCRESRFTADRPGVRCEARRPT